MRSYSVHGLPPAAGCTPARSILDTAAAARLSPQRVAVLWGATQAPLPSSDEPQAAGAPSIETHLALLTDDSVTLAATAFEPATAARAVAIIAPATGVPRGFYRSFARWLCSTGYAVLTLDYRGIGDSRLAAGPQRSASMVHWMQRDLPAAHAAARQRAAQGAQRLALLWVGHSLGGHALAQLPQVDQIDAAIGIAAQLPSYRLWPRRHQQWGARMFFRAWVPACVRVFGRLPGWAIGGGEPLPAAAALDWSRWGQMDRYFMSDPKVQPTASRWRGVAHLWWIEDDWVFGPRGAVEALQRTLDASVGSAEVRKVAPRDLGLQRVGHFGPFRRVAASLWPRMLDEIERAVPNLRGPT
jgi:predicted alpha/beta hydrolase